MFANSYISQFRPKLEFICCFKVNTIANNINHTFFRLSYIYDFLDHGLYCQLKQVWLFSYSFSWIDEFATNFKLNNTVNIGIQS